MQNIPTMPETLRIIPNDWSAPLDLQAIFGAPPQRLEIDLGCGKGRFLLARAETHPTVSFLGVDRQLHRIGKTERKALRASLCNIRLIRAEIAYTVANLLAPGTVATYYLFFPDPWPKRRHHRRRVFDPIFMDALHRTLADEGCLHVATDHLDYFTNIRDLLQRDQRFQEIAPFVTTAAEQSDFELIFLQQNLPIGRCSFRKAL